MPNCSARVRACSRVCVRAFVEKVGGGQPNRRRVETAFPSEDDDICRMIYWHPSVPFDAASYSISFTRVCAGKYCVVCFEAARRHHSVLLSTDRRRGGRSAIPASLPHCERAVCVSPVPPVHAGGKPQAVGRGKKQSPVKGGANCLANGTRCAWNLSVWLLECVPGAAGGGRMEGGGGKMWFTWRNAISSALVSSQP